MLRVLYLEDSAVDCELVQAMLEAEGIMCDIRRRDRPAEFLAELEKKDFDLIFADCSLPEFSGLKALEAAREKASEKPFIFISGTIGEDIAIESLRNGATDYVLKSRLSRLVPSVKRAIAEAAEKARVQEMEHRLRQAQRLEAVGTLAGGVAHDFNNILTIIKGHTSLLLMQEQTAERFREIGNTIDHATQRGAELVKQLLAFARKSDGSFTSTNLNARIRETIDMLREALPRNISFQLELDENIPDILADPGQVERVIINLATNARDAMPEGGTLTFVTGCAAENELPFPPPINTPCQYLYLRVIDTGSGMDEPTRQRMFEPFFTTKARGKGTGLGMPVVYGLMQSHNGVIDVTSELGAGTSISLYFPVPTAPVPVVTHERAIYPPQSVNGTECVLIVDDEPDVLYFLEVILHAHGYQVMSAHTAEEAQSILDSQSTRIDLLFSDLGLPKRDGFALAEWAKGRKPSLKVILASGFSDGSTKTRMAESGVEAFVIKPYDAPQLLQTIRAVLDRKVA